MKRRITFETELKRNQDQLFSEVDGEVVMLSTQNGEYYGLDRIGSQIWNILEDVRTFRQIVDQLLEEYEVNEETCIFDTKPLLEEFLNKGLIEIVDE